MFNTFEVLYFGVLNSFSSSFLFDSSSSRPDPFPMSPESLRFYRIWLMLIGINLFYWGELQKSSKPSMSSVSKYWRVQINLGEYWTWVLFRGEKSPFPTVDLQTVKNILSAVSKDEDSCLLMGLLKENPDFLSSFISISDTIPKGLNWVYGVFTTYFYDNLW